MAEKERRNDQLNITIVSLVAVVALVAVTAMVLNAATVTSVPQFATGSQVVSAEDTQNLVGEGRMELYRDDSDSSSGGTTCKSVADCSQTRCEDPKMPYCKINWLTPNKCMCK